MCHVNEKKIAYYMLSSAQTILLKQRKPLRACQLLCRTSVKSTAYQMDLKTLASHLDKVEIIHRTENFLVVNKDFDVVLNTEDPGRLSVHGQLAHKFPDMVKPELTHGFYVAHRLDYSTSGVLLVPLTKKASAQAAKCFEKRLTKKYYLAIVQGHISHETVKEISIGIGKDSRPEFEKIRMCPTDEEFCVYPKTAVTKYVLLDRGYFNNEPVSKILLYPMTGRRHQLRVHCKHIGHTILGDYTYSDKRDDTLYRMFLHAYRLIVPCSIQNIDIQTQDPFNGSDNLWKVSEKILSIEEAIKSIDNSCDVVNI